MFDASQSVVNVNVTVTKSVPKGTTAVAYAVATKGTVARQLGVNRAGLAANNFDGKVGQMLAVPNGEGVAYAVGVGVPDSIDLAAVRTAAANFARAASKHTHLAINLADLGHLDAKAAGRAVAEGALLGSYRYVGLKNDESGGAKLTDLTLVAGDKRSKGVRQGADDGVVVARAAALARELANTPPTYLNAKDIAVKAVEIAAATGLDVEVFNKDQLTQMGCGGMIGVNQGSTEPPRMVKLSYSRAQPDRSPRDGRQRCDVRLGRHQPEAQQPEPRCDENGYVGRGSGALGNVGAQGAEMQGQGHRLADVH